MPPTGRRPMLAARPLLLLVVLALALLLAVDGKRHRLSVRRQHGHPRDLASSSAAASASFPHHPQSAAAPSPLPAGLVLHAKAPPPGLADEFDPYWMDPPGPTDGGDGGDSAGGAGSSLDDEASDDVLAISLLALAVWVGVSALLVAGFVRRERRREHLLRFWNAIDAHPPLRRAVEQAAGGIPFPKPPRHSVLRRLLRATALALVVTLGLNVVLYTAKPTGPTAPGAGGGGGDDSGGSGGGGSNGTDTDGGGGSGNGGGGGDVPLDPTTVDGSPNPLLGVVFLGLFLASVALIAKGLHTLCCAPASSSSGDMDDYPGSGGGGGGAGLSSPASSATPYIRLDGSHGAAAAAAYYVDAVPVAATAPPASAAGSEGGDEQEQVVEEEDHTQGPPPPYSAALAATPVNATALV